MVVKVNKKLTLLQSLTKLNRVCLIFPHHTTLTGEAVQNTVTENAFTNIGQFLLKCRSESSVVAVEELSVEHLASVYKYKACKFALYDRLIHNSIMSSYITMTEYLRVGGIRFCISMYFFY